MLEIVLAVCLGLQTDVPTSLVPSLSLADGARIRYSNVLMREAYLAISPTDITINELEAAIFLSRKAALLQPTDSECWRMVLAVAEYSGESSPYAAATTDEAVGRLAKLCPADQVIRLRRILQEIERSETVEDRIRAFSKYLTPEAIRIIQNPVASRLAYDLALFESRMGDDEGFAKHLMQSLTLSSAFPAASEMAAGYISEKIDDSVAEAELLVAAAMANPTETRSWTRLGALLLQEGAYGSAARVYQFARATLRNKEDVDLVVNVVLADYTLALFGAGRPADAIQVIRQHFHDASTQQAMLIQTYNQYMTRAECEAVPYHLHSLLATIDVALCIEAKDPRAAAAIATLVASATAEAEEADPIADPIADPTAKPKTAESPQQKRQRLEVVAQDLIAAAVALAIFDADPDAIKTLVDLAAKRIPSSDDLKARFAAWDKFKGGDAAGALAIMDQSPNSSAISQLMRAKVLIATGDRRAAAKIFLQVALESQGTLIGIFASNQLRNLIGTGIAPSPIVLKLDGVVASIPALMERYLSGLDQPVAFQVEPIQEIVEPFDPIRYRLTMTNKTIIPLAVSPAGPIKSLVLLQPRISSSFNAGVDRLLPQIIAANRAIQLAPGESMSMIWNFQWTEVSLRLAQDPISGGIVDVRSASNFIAAAAIFNEGVFGEQPSAKSTIVNGIRVTPEWIESAIASARAPATDHDLVQLVLLTYVASSKNKPLDAPVKEAAWKAIAEGFVTLPPEAQAWVLLEGPRQTDEFLPVLELARATTHSDVRAAYLLSFCNSKDDSQLAASIRAGDEHGQRVHDVLMARFQRESVRADERMLGQSKGASAGAVERLKERQKDLEIKAGENP